MKRIDYSGALASNAGDDFHILWALHQALALLDQRGSLEAITLEEVISEKAEPFPPDALQGIDCTLYFGGASIESASRVEVVQLKYSVAEPGSPWTVTRVTQSSAKKGNNSVIRRLADAYAEVQKRSTSSTALQIRLVTNQPIDPVLSQLVNHPAVDSSEVQRLRAASGLDSGQFHGFLASLDLSQTGSRFSQKENVIRAVSSWTDGDAREQTAFLADWVRRKMLPESTRDRMITREHLLTALGFADSRALFPCPPELSVPFSALVKRQGTASIAAAVISGQKYVCLHGQAGSGKSTALFEIEQQLPEGSLMLVFDCYGAGTYLNSDAYRHRARDAFRQLANDLSAKLGVPLLLTQNDNADYPRLFHHRLEKAAQVLSRSKSDALLVVAIDAADNSLAAAGSRAPTESSFVTDVVNLSDLPDNVRLILTTRTGRLQMLSLSPRFGLFEIGGFRREETAEMIRSVWSAAPEPWIDEFHWVSGGNPRLQAYALRRAGSSSQRACEHLHSHHDLDGLFQSQFEDAAKKAGTTTALTRFSAVVTTLPRPVPLTDLSAISELSEYEINDICADFAPGIKLANGHASFADEDFESFIAERGRHLRKEMHRVIADRFLANQGSDPYAAFHLASALFQDGRGADILRIVEIEPNPAAIKDPVLQRETRLDRLRVAMRVCDEAGDQAAMLKILLIGAGAMKGNQASIDLMVKYPDLAAAFNPDTAARMILRDPRFQRHNGALLLNLLNEHAKQQNRVASTGARKQITAWFEERRRASNTDVPDGYQVQVPAGPNASDYAAEAEAEFILHGPESAVRSLRGCPSGLRLEAALLLIQRLVTAEKAAELADCVRRQVVKTPRDLLVWVPLALAGKSVDLAAMERALEYCLRHSLIQPRRLASFRDDRQTLLWLDSVLTACEIVVAKQGQSSIVISVLRVYADETLRTPQNVSEYQSDLLDLQLRALTLIAQCDGRHFALQEFVAEWPTPGCQTADSQKSVREATDRIRYLLEPLLHLYRARAQLLHGQGVVASVTEELRAAISSLDWHPYLESHAAAMLLIRVARATAILVTLEPVEPAKLLAPCQDIVRRASFESDSGELDVLSVIALNRNSHSDILEALTRRADSVASRQASAREKIEALAGMARLALSISRDDAHELFNLAHSATEEVDEEDRYMLQTLASMACYGAPTMAPAERRAAAGTIFTVAADADIRLSDYGHFPWIDIADAMEALDLPMALASAARWQDAATTGGLFFYAVLLHALRSGSMSPVEVLCLLPCVQGSDADLLDEVREKAAALPLDLRPTVIEEIARHIVLDGTEETIMTFAVRLSDENGAGRADGPWLQHLRETAKYLLSLGHRPLRTITPLGYSPAVSHPEPSETPANTNPRAFESPELLLRALEEELARSKAVGPPFTSEENILEAIRKTVPPSGRRTYLSSLGALQSESASGPSIASAISVALQDWAEVAAVRGWCRDELGKLVESHLEHFLYANARGKSALNIVLAALEVDAVPILTKGFAQCADSLDAAHAYQLVGILAKRMEPSQTARALLGHLDRCLSRIPRDQRQTISPTDVPHDLDSAIARLVFAFMSDCDVRVRWCAAHSFRRFARLHSTGVLTALRDVYDRQTEESFRAPDKPFYWMAARLWWILATGRIAYEVPGELVGYSSKLLSIASDTKFPHALIRSAARTTLIELSQRGQWCPEAGQLRLLRRSVGGRAPKGHRRQSAEPPEFDARLRERGFNFDTTDTIPYWYMPAKSVFADVSQEEFLDIAERWIVNEWRTPAMTSEPRRYRIPSDREMLDSHRHGTTPTLERWRTYLEMHAMFCVVGELADSSRALKEENSLDEWLNGWWLQKPPRWLVDLRTPVALEDRFWKPPASIDQWLTGFPQSQFLSELGLSGCRHDRITVRSRHSIESPHFKSEVTIISALVEPTTATALARSLQSASDPYDYYLPTGGRDEIEEPPYRLVSLLEDNHRSGGIDAKDPYRRSAEWIAIPWPPSTANLIERSSPEGWPVWVGKDNSAVYEHECWSRSSAFEMRLGGSRLSISVTGLENCLKRTAMDLIVSVEIRKERGDRDRKNGEEEKRLPAQARVFVLRANGDIEDASGRIGTWQAHRERT
ncbi:MAG: hypothetical protein U0Q16_25155 [Bryobacteraceae bacterium]